MGLDIALGVLVLFWAVRGWFRGFVLQVVRLIGLVACIFAADPVRDLAKPRVFPYLPKIHPELIDRGLWWAAAVLSYIVLVGLSSLAVKLYRRKPLGLEEPNRNDQFAGALLGIAKGVIVAAFLVGALQKYAIETVKTMPWALQQTTSSRAIKWDATYRPSERIWTSPPVQVLVHRVKSRGLTGAPEPAAEAPIVQTASRVPADPWSSKTDTVPDAKAVADETVKAVEAVQEELSKAATAK